MARGVKTGGRQKGSSNKVTKTIKEAFAMAFHDLQKDQKKKLTTWAKANPTEFYKLAAKLIPTELTGSGGAPLIPEKTTHVIKATLNIK